jgi:hypothetical protein
VWLHVGVLRPEQRLGSLDGQSLDVVGQIAAEEISLAWIPFDSQVGEDGSLCLQDGLTDCALRGDELDGRVLPDAFALQESGDFRVNACQFRHGSPFSFHRWPRSIRESAIFISAWKAR